MSNETRSVPLPRGMERAGTVTVHPSGDIEGSGFAFNGAELTGGLATSDLAVLWAAGHLLHGRLTWEMVDALRECAENVEHDAGPMGMGYYSGARRAHVAAALALADLLESLLPPRGPNR